METEETERNETVARAPKVIPPEVVQQMNYKMWEAAIEGNEPLFVKAVESGANVNAFCRLKDKWKNITVGEIAGFDESQTGLNVHWMELNNYTALHLAAACGNAAIIDKLIEYGADINVECLQRINPFPTAFGFKIPLLSVNKPLIYKCTPLRIARAANCGRCFYTSYQKCVDKLEAAKAVDNDFHYPAVIMGSAFLLAYLGLKGWPFEWFEEWPYNWADYPDLAKYLPR
ncbi:hypothetical protein GUITHDRAFT_104421 [Guillardia theta CCMP2712]|uniref:Uncharacterized protein n=1 Tax=Guillardia theta (strain CCMP2712) TaxID=905079 RepID=L1JPM9_GUITC|nr:hypothetical protein GUITHDRAFT_104421 [Guillardia theta CCMP2712]EKX50023.1 hypothetical protein GUITHDRAFT_104421 [Guillardia theta CCMP2712]|eukprot:XP_005837003.1 hypothetical protein GUITHDRAFT_104421 [Guillardia theta CCMP2712]